jgi:hypothetical protein
MTLIALGNDVIQSPRILHLCAPCHPLAGSSPRKNSKYDSAEKPYECFDWAQHERKFFNDFKRSSVRPEALEG